MGGMRVAGSLSINYAEECGENQEDKRFHKIIGWLSQGGEDIPNSLTGASRKFGQMGIRLFVGGMPERDAAATDWRRKRQPLVEVWVPRFALAAVG